ncbi:MAG: SAM-dependent methlyltransferase [Bacteroidetes bacterium]|jgi:thiopurine S-methyltransferase|nr:SAM-dependent methlyltransferase [Bacteroidota bacterium]
MQLDKNYWTQRYLNNDAAWDTGSVTQPLKEYIDQLNDKNISILIPGAGNAYEAEYFFKQGFKNVTIIDLSQTPLNQFKKRLPEFPEDQLVHGDFFDHTIKYDLIIEQTFFCALDPSLRSDYSKKMHELLKPEGKLVGLLFNDKLNTDKPPFGGTKEEYLNYFEKHFEVRTFDTCYNSIKPRAGRELFINLEKI